METAKQYHDEALISRVCYLEILEKNPENLELVRYAQYRYYISISALRCYLSMSQIMDYHKSKECPYKKGSYPCQRFTNDSRSRKEEKKRIYCLNRGSLCVWDQQELLFEWATDEYKNIIVGLDVFDPKRVTRETKYYYQLVRKGVKLS